MNHNKSELLRFIDTNKLPPLRDALRDKNGMEVILNSESWYLNFGWIRPLDWTRVKITPVIEYAFRAWLEYRVANFAPATVESDFKVMCELIEFTEWPKYSAGAEHNRIICKQLQSVAMAFIENRRMTDQREGKNRLESYLERVRGWYGWSLKYELPGFDKKFSVELAKIKAPQRRNGQAVMSWDPGSGPLTRLEELQFRGMLLRDAGPLSEQVSSWLTYGMGLRPQQTVLLLENDLKIFVASNGEKFYQLDVPRVKRKGNAVRSEMRRRKIGVKLGSLLEQLKKENQEIVTESGCERPLLMRPKPVVQLLRGAMRQWAYKRHPNYIAESLNRFVNRNKLISVRTGKKLNPAPRRLRYTFATNKAESLEPAVLAELLDHSDIRSVLVYYNARETIGQELGQKLGKMDGPTGYRTIINAFAGIKIKVVSRDTENELGGAAMRRFPPPEMVTDDMRELPGLGGCGGNYKCGMAPIVSCYICEEFRAWEDADHQAIVDWLSPEIERLRALPDTPESTLNDFELALINAQQICLEQGRLKSKSGNS